MYQVVALVFDGFQSSGVMSPFDVFNVTNTLWAQQNGQAEPLYACSLASQDGGMVTASNGVTMRVDYSFADVPKTDLVIVPGIHHTNIKELIKSLGMMDRERRWLLEQHKKGAYVAANCSGAFLLADTGVLQGKAATTAWWLAELFKQRYPQVDYQGDTLLVQNGKIFSTGAMMANLGVMLQIVEAQVGRQLALSCAKTMLIDANQIYASPYLFVQDQSDHQDTLVLEVESWMQRHMAQPVDMVALADLHAVSVRTLLRRFKKANGVSPSEYLQNLRLEHTRLLLETTNLSIEQLVERVGYSSQSSLRRLFHKHVSMSPSAYRQQHRAQSEGSFAAD